MKHLLFIALAIAFSTGCWTEQEAVIRNDAGTDSDSDTDTNSDSDTGSDSDSASDSDTETDWCTAPEGITDWGGPCHTTADCPPDTECAILNFLDDTQGFCAPDCCNLSTPDTDYCTDVAAGLEGCDLLKTQVDAWEYPPPYYCLIYCNTQADCPTGTACLDTVTGGLICYGYSS